MKRKGIILGFVLLTALAINGLFAFDLWNGIDTNMTKDQIVDKAKQVLSVTRPTKEEARESLKIFVLDLENNNNMFPQNLVTVELISPMSDYMVDYNYDRQFNRNLNDPMPNVTLYFSNNRLLAIVVFWNRDLAPETILSRMIRINGNTTGTITHNEVNAALYRSMGMPTNVYHAWETQEKLTFLWAKNMCIINKSLLIR
jgi:hypothetical protein